MEPTNGAPTVSSITPPICEVCHQPIATTFYFCPNCGAKITNAPLSTTTQTQIGLYIFSFILPWIAFIMITRWKGITYLGSRDPQARQVGIIATVILVASTIFTFYLAYMSLTNMVQSQIAAVNTDMNF